MTKGSIRPDLQNKAWFRLRAQILERDNYVCWMCKGTATLVDHLTPVSQGGTSNPDNLAAACKPCNDRKNNRWSPPPARTIDW